MNDLLLLGLQDIYYAENQIVKALPKLIDKATSRDLTKGLKDHLEETKNQIERLDQAFEKLGKKPGGLKCRAIDVLIKEGDEIAGEIADKEVLDAAIVGAAQAVEALRDGTLRHADRLGGGARPRRYRALLKRTSTRRSGGQKALDRGAAQGRQPRGSELIKWRSNVS